jgi:hypothetical protein
VGAAVPKLYVSLSLSLSLSLWVSLSLGLSLSVSICASRIRRSASLVTYVCSQGISVLKAAGAGEMGLLPDFLVILSQQL